MTSAHRVKYNKKYIDYFMFVDEDKRAWLIPIEKLENKIIITLDKKVNTTRSWETNERFKSEYYRIS